MNVSTALGTLDDAVSRYMTENVNTPEVLAALDFLGARATIRWPFEQYRKALAPKDGEFDFDKEGRRQVLNASLNGIKRALGPTASRIHMLKTLDGEQVDPKEIDYPIRGGIKGQKDITGVIMKDGKEKWLKHSFDEVLKLITNPSK
jgi:hypothetical protein